MRAHIPCLLTTDWAHKTSGYLLYGFSLRTTGPQPSKADQSPHGRRPHLGNRVVCCLGSGSLGGVLLWITIPGLRPHPHLALEPHSPWSLGSCLPFMVSEILPPILLTVCTHMWALSLAWETNRWLAHSCRQQACLATLPSSVVGRAAADP